MDLNNAVTAGTLVFIGTATTLIRYGELTILTDRTSCTAANAHTSGTG